MPAPIESGSYARKQIYCPNKVVAWSHGSRFKLAATLAAERGGTRLLDYGCGDGTFIALTHGIFPIVVGADIDAAQLDDCRRRLGDLAGVSFVRTADLKAGAAATYDVVTCMETLEHCVDTERLRVLEDLRRLASAGGRIVISVPI
jgi:2-polyprenyl-3-methyl-5-hydroxy-6-metoxy-1,4-benzoquinol methylase